MPVKRPGPDFERFKRAFIREMTSAVRYGMDLAEREVKRRYSGPTGADRLGVRTGTLRRSVFRQFRGGPPPKPIVGRIYIRKAGSGYFPVYARIHELGGVIRPKRAQWLAIPLGALRTKAGVSAGQSPRLYDGFFFTSKRGNLIFAVRAPGGGLNPLFVLKRSVRIKPRPVWRAMRRKVRRPIRKRFDDAMRRIARAA